MTLTNTNQIQPPSTNPVHTVTPVSTLLTTRRFHPTAIALVNACAALGMELIPSRRLDWRSVLVFQWGYDLPPSRRAIRGFCAEHGIDFVNPRVMGKWSQIEKLRAAGVPVPTSRCADNRDDALRAAHDIGFPVVLQPLFGRQSRGGILAENDDALVEKWENSHRVVQVYLPEGDSCARLLVVGHTVIYAITRVAEDSFRATDARSRRVTLEPFALTDELERLAVDACRALGVSIGGIDLVQTADGPMILEVNHRRLALTNRALHGRDAVNRVASYLCERARHNTPRHPCVQSKRGRRICIATGLPNSQTTAVIQRACERDGLETQVGTRIDFKADAVILWGLEAKHYRTVSAKAQAIAVPTINGTAHSLWEQRCLLYQAGIKIPRSRRASNLNQAIRLADVVGYPVFLRPDGDFQEAQARSVSGRKQLETVWRDDIPCVIEEVRWAMQTLIRIWVVGEKAVFAEQRFVPNLTRVAHDEQSIDAWHTVSMTSSQATTAVRACRALDVDVGVVELIPEADGDTVVGVHHRNLSLSHLPDEIEKTILQELLQKIQELFAPNSIESEDKSQKPLRIGLARPYASRGSGYRIWNIYALYRECLRQGHQIFPLRRRFNTEVVAQADFILQDPLHAFGFGRRVDRLNRLLYRHRRERSHLLRRPNGAKPDKRVMAQLARRLGVHTPRLLALEEVTVRSLPVIVKPWRGSLGRGVRLVQTLPELRRLAHPSRIIQEYIDSGTSYAVSMRVITVSDRIAAAALFYHRGRLCSNLHTGGRAIALTGPGRYARPTPEEAILLHDIGIKPTDRHLPKDVEEMAAQIGKYYSQHGVQMLGQDFIVDDQGRWYFLEVNTAFGLSIFNVTDGEGYPSSRRGFVYAGRVLEGAVVEVFS